MKKSKIRLLSSLMALLILVGSCAYLQLEQKHLSEKIIRLHVVANSDTQADQTLKLEVRDAVLQALQPVLQNEPDPEQAVRARLPMLQKTAEDVLRSRGCEDAVTVRLGRELFPTRTYDTFSLPSGVYESLRVSIGQAAGHNWWCVIFPSICLSASSEDLRAAAAAAGFSNSEIGLITGSGNGYVLKFKVLELFQRLKNYLF